MLKKIVFKLIFLPGAVELINNKMHTIIKHLTCTLVRKGYGKIYFLFSTEFFIIGHPGFLIGKHKEMDNVGIDD